MINENPSAFFLLKNNQQKVHLLLRRKNVVCHFLVRFMHRSRFIITATNFGPFFLCYPKRPIRMLAWTKKTTLNGLWTANRPLGHRFKWIPLEAGNPEGTALLHSRCSMDQFLLCCSYDVTYMDSIPLCFLFSAMNFLVFIPPLRLPFCLNISATKRNISIGYAGQQDSSSARLGVENYELVVLFVLFSFHFFVKCYRTVTIPDSLLTCEGFFPQQAFFVLSLVKERYGCSRYGRNIAEMKWTKNNTRKEAFPTAFFCFLMVRVGMFASL